MAGVTFEHVTKRYGDEVVGVDDLDLAIADGEFMVLVGPSGCGKTTALRCVAGLEDITSGRLRIGDRVVNRVPSKDRDIAMVFQSYALYPHMSVFENLAFGLKLLKTPKAEIKRRVEEAAEILDLSQLLDRKPKQLSGRPAPARRAWPRDRARASRVPHGRAAVEPRREASRPDPGGDPPPPAPAGDDHDLRHARPGRGDDDGRPDRGDEHGRPPAGRRPRGSSTTGRTTCSWPPSSARRR